jgi:hypothetical protein
MEPFEPTNDSERIEISPQQLCQALASSLDPLSDLFIALIDGEEPKDEADRLYMRWAVPTAIITRAMIIELEEEAKSGEDYEQADGLHDLVNACPEFDMAFSAYEEDPSRELMLLAAESWMQVREASERLLEYLDC